MPRKRLPETEAPERLEKPQQRAVYRWMAEEFSQSYSPELWDLCYQLTQQCLDWHGSRGIRRHSWKRTIQNWIRKAINDDLLPGSFRRRQFQRELPQEPRTTRQPRSENLVSLSEYLGRKGVG